MERKENVLFNDALSTFCLRLYGVGHNMVDDHPNSERGNPISSKGSHTTAFVTPVVEHWMELEIVQ